MIAAQRTRVALAAIALVALLAGAAAAAQAANAPSPQKQVARAFKTLTKETRQVPKRNLSAHSRARLLRKLKQARKLSKPDPCHAVKALNVYRLGLRKVHERRLQGMQTTAGSFRGQLEANALELHTALMQLPKARKCGGGDGVKTKEAQASVLEADATHIVYKVELPAPTFAAQQVHGTEYQQMFMEGMGESGDVGDPGLPVFTHNFAIPNGAELTTQVTGAESYKVPGVELFPTQEEPVDAPIAPVAGAPDEGLFQNKPFEIDNKAYKSGDEFPAQVSQAGPMGTMRDLAVGGVDAVGGQYTPKTDTLQVFTSMKIEVQFLGGSGFGNGTDIKNAWDAHYFSNYGSLLDNFQSIVDRVNATRLPRFCGEEMLVVTSAALRPAANTFATAKTAMGIFTRVVETGSGTGQAGTTPGAIQAFIRSHLNSTSCLLRPTYVVLFGNTAAVPTFLVPCSPGGNPADCNIASDLPYSLSNDSDLFADVMLGRIPTPDITNAAAVVTKIINYETTMPAPAGDDFYSHATVTSYYQPPLICVLNEGATGAPNCNGDAPPVTGHWEINYPANTDTRGFTITAERIRNAMAALSYNVDRLYTTDDEDVIPLNYWNGTPIPAHLRRPSFPWNSNTTDFLNAYNGGRFLILHRDHGWPDGWAEPTLHSGHVPGFTNGTKLPVVFGINCASAAFDTPDHPSFVELQVIKPDGGAFAGFGDTRVSPSFPNNHMALGFFDALFPNTVPDYGSPTPTRRLGDVLVRGKQYMATQEGFEWHGSGDTYVEHYLYHLLGDPSAQMWAAEPVVFRPPHINVHYIKQLVGNPGDPPFSVLVNLGSGPGEPPAFGTVVTLFHDGAAIGRGVVGGDGSVEVIPDESTPSDDLTVSLDQQGAFPTQKEVGDVPTTLTLTAPGQGNINVPNSGTFSGHLDPSFAGGQVRIVYTPDDQQPRGQFTETVTTDANGDYSDTVTFDNPNAGDWHAQAFFDGGGGYNPSQSSQANFVVHDNL